MRLWKCNFWVNEIRISHIARDTRAWTCAHNPKLFVRYDNIKYTIHVKMGHFIHVDGSIDVKKIQWEFFLPYSKSNALTFEARDFEIMLLNLLLQALEKVGSLFAVHGQLLCMFVVRAFKCMEPLTLERWRKLSIITVQIVCFY